MLCIIIQNNIISLQHLKMQSQLKVKATHKLIQQNLIKSMKSKIDHIQSELSETLQDKLNESILSKKN